jgi:hypothetical protein
MFFVVVRSHFGGVKEDPATAIAEYERQRSAAAGTRNEGH